jgi:hypothetical protein
LSWTHNSYFLPIFSVFLLQVSNLEISFGMASFSPLQKDCCSLLWYMSLFKLATTKDEQETLHTEASILYF